MLYGLSEDIEFTSADGCDAPPDLIMRDVRDQMRGNGRRHFRSSGSNDAIYEVDFSFRAFLEVMFLVPPMVIYLRTDAGQSDDQAKVRTKQRVAGASGLQHETVITNVTMSDSDKTLLPLLLGHSKGEEERKRGGIHLYWNNVLIIAYFCTFEIMDGVIGIANVSQVASPARSSCLTLNRRVWHRWTSLRRIQKRRTS